MHRFAAELVDHMPVIDDMAMGGIAPQASARQRHGMGAADEQLEPVITESHAPSMPDQPRGHGVDTFLSEKLLIEVMVTMIEGHVVKDNGNPRQDA